VELSSARRPVTALPRTARDEGHRELAFLDRRIGAGGRAPPDSPVHWSGVCPGQRLGDQAFGTGVGFPPPQKTW